jgi:hypothetical protein
MIKQNHVMLLLSLFLLFIGGAINVSAQDKTVWLACTWDTSSIFKGKDGKEKFERRFYVSNLVSMTREEYLKIDSTGDRIEGLCGSYIDNTVMKAAAERGEKLEGGTLTVIRNIELSGEDAGGSKDVYTTHPKEDVQKKLAESVKEARNFDRFIMFFNWDPTGKNEAADYASEKKNRALPTPSQKTTQP